MKYPLAYYSIIHMQQRVQNHYPFLRNRNLQCLQDCQAKAICISENCQQNNSLLCQNEKCVCKKYHMHCEKILLEKLYTKIQQRRIYVNPDLQKAIEEVQQSYDNISDLVSQSRLKFQDSIDHFGLGVHTINFIKMMKDQEAKIVFSKDLSKKIIKQNFSNDSIICPYPWQLRQLKLNVHNQIEQLIEKYNCLYFGEQQTQKKQTLLQKISQMDPKPIFDLSGIFKCSVAEWLKSGKKIRQVQMISLYTKDIAQALPGIKIFTNLQVLTLSNCSLKKIPNELKQIKFLIELDLGNNNQIQIIQNLQQCIFLKRLMLNSNKIKKIQNLQNLGELFLLDLSYNQISKIQNIRSLKKLKKIFLVHNTIIQGEEHTRNELKILKDSGIQVHLLSYDLQQ